MSRYQPDVIFDDHSGALPKAHASSIVNDPHLRIEKHLVYYIVARLFSSSYIFIFTKGKNSNVFEYHGCLFMADYILQGYRNVLEIILNLLEMGI